MYKQGIAHSADRKSVNCIVSILSLTLIRKEFQWISFRCISQGKTFVLHVEIINQTESNLSLFGFIPESFEIVLIKTLSNGCNHKFHVLIDLLFSHLINNRFYNIVFFILIGLKSFIIE